MNEYAKFRKIDPHCVGFLAEDSSPRTPKPGIPRVEVVEDHDRETVEMGSHHSVVTDHRGLFVVAVDKCKLDGSKIPENVRQNVLESAVNDPEV